MLVTWASSIAQADVIINGPGNIVLAEEGGSFDAGNLASPPGATAFALDVFFGGAISFHQTTHLTDGVYGNANSWIGETPASFVGVNLGATTTTVASIAFGRDTLGGFTDRSLGLFKLQYTQVANPGVSTSETGNAGTGWFQIGTLDYGAGVPGTNYRTPSLRHRYNFDAVDATGIRIVPPAGAAIDEIELYASPGAIQPPPPVVELLPEAGFDITYNGNDGDHFNQNPPRSAVGPHAPANLARSGTAFGSSEFGAGGIHLITNVNDGYYGNSNSWLPDFVAGDPTPSIGIDLGGEFLIDTVAWSRDNGNGAFDDSFAGTDCCGGQADDRCLGIYTIQITTDPDPGTTSAWTTVGTVEYSVTVDTIPGGGFTPWLRHQFGITTAAGDPLMATGLRILPPHDGITIDELEIYPSVDLEISSIGFVAVNMLSITFTSVPGQTYALDASTSLSPTSFMQTMSNVASQGTSTTVLVPVNPASTPARFFRVRRL